MGVTKTEPFQCPQCLQMNNALGTLDKKDNYVPDKNAVIVCTGCGAVCFIEEELSLRLATEDDMRAILLKDAAAYKLLKTAQAFIALRNKRK